MDLTTQNIFTNFKAVVKVKDLQKALEKFDPEARVCIEAYSDCAAYMAKQYILENGEKYAYIADSMEYVEEVFRSPIKEYIVGYEEV